MSDRQVSCITVANQLIRENITHIGGTNPSSFYETEPNAIAQIDRGVHTYYTLENGKRANVRVERPTGRKPYLTTAPDAYKQNNLLSLLFCR